MEEVEEMENLAAATGKTNLENGTFFSKSAGEWLVRAAFEARRISNGA